MARDPDEVHLSAHDRGEFGMPNVGAKAHELMEGVGPALEFQPGKVWEIRESMPDYVMKITEHSIAIDYGDSGIDYDAPTEDARVILAKILPHLLLKFLEKNEKYAEVEKGYDLEEKGIVPDLNRKLGIIKARLWDGAPEVGESTDEVLEDMVGHILLMLAKRYRRGM